MQILKCENVNMILRKILFAEHRKRLFAVSEDSVNNRIQRPRVTVVIEILNIPRCVREK